jgi:hypothetical protein
VRNRFSTSKRDHLAHVAEALTLLGNAGLSLKLKSVISSPKLSTTSDM